MYRNHFRPAPTSIIALMVGLSALPTFAAMETQAPPDDLRFTTATDLTDMDSIEHPFVTSFATALRQRRQVDLSSNDVLAAAALVRQLDEIFADDTNVLFKAGANVTVQMRDATDADDIYEVTYHVGDQTFERQIGANEFAQATSWLTAEFGPVGETSATTVTAEKRSAEASQTWRQQHITWRTGLGARTIARAHAFLAELKHRGTIVLWGFSHRRAFSVA